MTVLKLCVAQGANALDMAVPIVAEEAEAFQPAKAPDGFVEAMPLAELPPGTSTTVTIEGKQIAVFNVAGEIYATNDACPHAGASLGWGKLEGKVVKCRAHGLCFDVTKGAIVGGSGLTIQTHEARVEGDKILIKLG